MKIDPKGLAFDIDGVVADTMSLFLAIADKEFGIRHIRYEEITDYSLVEAAVIDHGVMWEIILRILEGRYDHPLSPIIGAPDVLRRLNRICSPTLFVTARPEAEHISGWLCDVLETGRECIEVVATGSFEDKQEVLAERNITHFVEDMLAKAGITPIVFRQPWNRKSHPFAEVGNWKELEALISME
jgi:hypothetical protein